MKRVLLTIILVLLVIVGATSLWVYKDLRTPVWHSKSGHYIDIPRGSTPTLIMQKLASEGVLKHTWPLAIYLKITVQGAQFKAGEYNFPSPISPLGVLAKLRQGERRLIRFTVVEGWTRWDIANAIARIPELPVADPVSVLPLMNETAQINDLDPLATNLEGYLFPDTYEFSPETKPSEIIAIMVKRFRKEWKPEWAAKARLMDLSPRQIVTTASLIETEAKLGEERPLIASVIYNRLKKNMPLAVDSTVIYASKLEGKWRNDGKVYKSDVERRSPYNTRLHSGLPPGPIASPGKSSLEAALDPAETEYLYYVREPSRNDGAHNFYLTERDFAVGVQALRNWERQRDIEDAKGKALESTTLP